MIELLTFLLNDVYTISILLLGITVLSFSLKIFLLSQLVVRGSSTGTSKRPWIFLVIFLICSMVGDSAWIFALIKKLWLPNIDYRIYLFWIRVAWGVFAIQYQALTHFMESLVNQSESFSLRQKLFTAGSFIFCSFAFGLAIFDFNCPNASQRPEFEFLIRNCESYFTLLVVMLSTLFITLYRLRTKPIPRILKKQLKILIPVFIIPMWIFDLLQAFPLITNPTWQTNSYLAMCISTLFLAYSVYYSARRVMHLRFLNLESHVLSIKRFSFIDSLKYVLEQLSHAATLAELRHVSKTLFKDSFHIPPHAIKLYIRKLNTSTGTEQVSSDAGEARDGGMGHSIEGFIDTNNEEVGNYIRNAKILIYDEITFNNFYEKTNTNQIIINFLESLHADIFLPIYEKENLIAYIVVDRYARQHLYGNVERDEMLIFARYLGAIIHLMQSRNINLIMRQEKELKEELYHKHQETNQYKESIRSFLRNSQQKDIGIIFYKNRRFIFANKAANDLVGINVNLYSGHPITQALKRLANQVEEYKEPQSCFATNNEGERIVLSGVPNLEQSNVIITVGYPDISDVIKKQIDLLQDPTQWDYLLYLETTKTGKLISQLVPGTGETLLNFKIALLKIALSRKAILLDMPEEDLTPTVELLHHISLRERLQAITIANSAESATIAIQLFGINPLFSPNNQSRPILEQLHETGTLFIKNIHLLDLETQEYLAEFIRYGLYRMFKSDQKMASDVRIICSSNQDLYARVQEGTFSKRLFNELKHTTLSMPSLISLPDDELSDLVEGFAQQAIKTTDLKNLLELTDKEKISLATKRPVSLYELKDKIQKLLIQKSKNNNIYTETEFDPAYQLSDHDLIKASRLGKQALRDQKIMMMLWQKFKNQSKIAAFLGVNRSSVNRRYKEFGIE